MTSPSEKHLRELAAAAGLPEDVAARIVEKVLSGQSHFLKERSVAEVDKAPFKETDVTKDTKTVLGDQQTKSSSDPKGDVTAKRTEKQVVRGTIKPGKEG